MVDIYLYAESDGMYSDVISVCSSLKKAKKQIYLEHPEADIEEWIFDDEWKDKWTFWLNEHETATITKFQVL